MTPRQREMHERLLAVAREYADDRIGFIVVSTRIDDGHNASCSTNFAVKESVIATLADCIAELASPDVVGVDVEQERKAPTLALVPRDFS